MDLFYMDIMIVYWLCREMDQTMGQTGEFDIAEYYRLHLAVEKIRLS